ncbi:LuxR C-terminal-related transcriptional regulator [Solirubrobacter ginsenosidimutans]|uniref:LuxR C-terminal-related transcriptional regulator n=1 Tax=Solirubrobacter ginsenosidimutans TaxID=490573 RepID=A0A9X3N512_9ACTN|nr:AAA family ATPase [Solirubrobacter ginsenosidimutans]MDA0167381.1 LuxR C-terminal-related transcriptional regulator [Solirubrobacter ginsenosidimutans]
MSGPQAGGALETAELSFDLIEAKLAPPALRAETVAKSQLIDRVCASEERVVSVVAPAGFGKTTLLAHLAPREERAFAMVSLDDHDNDPVLLLRYVAAALDRVEPIPVSVFEALSMPGRSLWSTCIPRVCAALSAVAHPVVLALDDLHFVSDPTCLDAVAALLNSVPEGSRIVLASREVPALPLARLRSQRRLLEVDVEDLRLNAAEAGALLRSAGVELDEPAIRELTKRTEGWPAGLYLAALSLQAGGCGVSTFTGEDRFVAEYLRLELLSRLTDEEVRFLTHTSVLERMCGSLCDAVLGRTDSAGVLESLERSNRFLVPLDRTRTWYRYHHLFQDLLRSELEQREPGLVPELNRRAMAWCQANGMPEPALHYAHAAGETDAMTRIFEELVLPTYYAGGASTVESWLDWYDDDLFRRYPTIAVLGAWVYYLGGQTAEGERCQRAAQTSTATPELPDGSASIEPWLAALRAYTCPNGVQGILADAELALEQLGPEGWWRPTAQLAAGAAHAFLGDSERAVPALVLAAEVAAAAGSSEEETLAYAELALLAIEAGAWEQAAAHAERAVAVAEAAKIDDYLTGGLPWAVSARVALHHGHTERARDGVARAHRIRPLLNPGMAWISIQTGLELARVHLALKEPGVAGTVLSEAEAILRVRPNLGTLTTLAHELRGRITASATPSGEWALSLTAAELRLLPLLTTHLAFPQIGQRLHLSRTTIKTQAISIYRKFGVSSRAEAIGRAVELGLLEDSRYPAIDLGR